MTWIATDFGAQVTTITFKTATGIIDNGNGPEPARTTEVIIPVRLSPVPGRDITRVLEQSFPGTDDYQFLFYGWVNDRKNYKIPDQIRQQKKPTGKCIVPGFGEGKIQCSIGMAVDNAAEMIGEKFTAIWSAV